jgi:hypothetical protein
MIQKYKFISIFFIILITVSAFFYLSIRNLRNDIYFDMWLNDVVNKNNQSSFFQKKDPYWGNEVETKFKIDSQRYINLKNIETKIDYHQETKTLRLFLNTPNSSSKKNAETFYYKYSDLKKELSEEICSNILFILSDYSGPLHQGKQIDVTQNYIKYINCYFTFDIDHMAAGEPVGGIIYKRSKKEGLFNFEFLKRFSDADFS